MIPIGDGAFVIDSPVFRDSDLRANARQLFEEMERSAEESLSLDDYGLHLEVEQGSLKGKALIFVSSVGVLYTAIAKYPDFVQGVQLIGSHAKHVIEEVVRLAPLDFGQTPKALRSKRTDAGRLTQLNRLFTSVARGEMSADEATTRALEILDVHDDAPPHFVDSLSNAMHGIKLDPRQLQLPAIEAPPGPSPRMPRVPVPGPTELAVADLRTRLKIELHKEHKDSKTVVKVTPLGKQAKPRR